MQKYHFVTCIHGNETMPSLALSSLGISHLIANPKAVSLGARFTETDLNASFGLEGNSHEIIRAKQILEQINPNQIVIDIHTTSAITPPFAIITDIAMLNTAMLLGLKHIVLMSHNIKNGHALIDHCNGVSIEAGLHNSEIAFQTTLDVVSSLKRSSVKNDCLLYEVYDKISSPGQYFNFQEHEDGFIPVLAGEVSYTFPGLKSRIINFP